MRIDVDYGSVERYNHFSFDKFSDLSQEIHPDDHCFEQDSDVLIHRYVIDFWLKDILNRQGEVDDLLYEKAKQLDFVQSFNISQHPDILNMFVYIRQKCGHRYRISSIYDESLLSEEKKQDILRSSQEFDFQIVVQDYYIDDIVQEIVMLIIETGYSPDRDSIDDFLQDNDQDFYSYAHNFSIKERLDRKIDVYLLMVLLYPSDNLPEYFHDCIAYRNSKLFREGEQCSSYDKKIVDDRILLIDPIDHDIYKYVIKEIVSLFD